MRRITIAIVVSFVVVSCTSDTSLPIDEYAEEISAAASDYVQESQSISLRYQGDVERKVAELATGDSPTAIDEAAVFVRGETVRYLAQLHELMGRYRDALSEIEPPGDLATSHDGYVDIVGTVHDTLPALRAAVDAATTIESIGQALAGSGFADGQPAWVAACSSLEQSIRDLGYGADLKCVKTDVAP